MPLLAVRDLSVEFRTTSRIVHAVRGVSFDIAGGDRVGIVGESGSGKTTIALALLRMIKPPGRIAGGSATLGDLDLFSLPPGEVRQARLRDISYVPQGAMNALNPVLRVREQILDGIVDHGISLPRDRRQALVRDALESVGLPPATADLFPHQLSGGMKQRVCIAIAISLKPRLIIADEPTSALDVITQRQVIKTLCDLQERMHCGLILIGHDMGLMAQVAHRVIVMREGLIVEDSPVHDIFRRPKHDYSRTLIESIPSLANRPDRPSAPRPVAAAAPEALFEFEAVAKIFGGNLFDGPGKVALQPCSFSLRCDCPQTISVVGQSGSGKTTMARMILGLEASTSGTVRYRGVPLARLSGPEARRYRREVQAIFQDPYGSFNPFYKVDHALIDLVQRFGLASGRKAAYAQAAKACGSVGLDAQEILGRFPHELSGGQRQRLMVARALLLRPRIIVADEPVSMVDASLRLSILDNMQSLKNEHDISIIYITHDLATAYHVSDYVLVLHEGRIVEAGLPSEVILRPAHPYTQALVDAIPWPDPDRGWADRDAEAPADWQAASVMRGQIEGFRLGVPGSARLARVP
jgi:peptide/nickel transport system ATP-binding protein